MDSSPPVKPNRPRALQPGDTLAVVAPASPFDRQSFDTGVRALESMQFHVRVDEVIFTKKDYLAGSDRRRADLINRSFKDPDVDGIICARGGYGAMRILPLLDSDAIAQHPKVFVGFSDITALLSFLVDHCGMAAFHGPTVTTLGDADDATRDRFLKALTSPEPICLEAKSSAAIQPGKASGRLLCGNLSLLCHLTGTPFQPDFKGSILLIEDRGEAPYRIDRMLTHMVLAGCFNNLAGLAVGSFSECGSRETILNIVADRLGKLDIPILAGFEVGHEGVNTTLPVGLPACLDTYGGTLTVTEPALV